MYIYIYINCYLNVYVKYIYLIKIFALCSNIPKRIYFVAASSFASASV